MGRSGLDHTRLDLGSHVSKRLSSRVSPSRRADRCRGAGQAGGETVS